MSPNKRVFLVIGGCGDAMMRQMFIQKGWELVNSVEEADLVQFTGGEDIDPSLYGEHKHNSVYFNRMRDDREQIVFNKALKLGIPMAGICRGAQFLCAMSGGSLWQDVNNHGRSHNLLDRATGRVIHVSSTHHQMMRPDALIASGEAVGIATSHLSTRKERMNDLKEAHSLIICMGDVKDTVDWESVFFPKTKCLSFQPHPEYGNYEECTTYYFELISKYLEPLL